MQNLSRIEKKSSSNSFGALAGFVMFVILAFLNNPDFSNLSSVIYWGVVFACLGILFARICMLKKDVKINLFVGWYVAFLCICITSLLYSIDLSASTETLKSMVVNGVVLFSIMWTIETKEDLNAVIKILMYAIIFNAVYLCFVVDWSLMGVERMDTDVIGYGWNANSIGLMMLWGTAICCYLAKVFKKKTYYLPILVFLPLIIYSGSRKVWIGFVLFLLFMIYINNKRRLFISLIISAIVLIAIYNLVINVEFFYNAGGNRLEDFFNGFFGISEYDSSAEVRDTYIKYGWEWFWENPIIGYGINAFRALLKPAFGRYTYSHNNFIELLVDLGIIGFIIFYFMYIKVIKRGLKNIFGKGKDKSSQAFILVAMITLNTVLQYAMVTYQSLLDLFLLLVVYLYFQLQEKNAFKENVT